MKSYLAYIRVSTVKQGEHGSSLQEQRDAITAFAARNGLSIAAWFEERETAAKVGRREFSRMLTVLRKRKAAGVIFHKIDRSIRNLKDWNAIQDLADQGIDIRFTQESINLGSNEGKLTGDFLAVISSHYVRNLREEVRKGIRGRLKQGLYPLPAPLGYLNQGGGKPKIPDPIRAPFIRDAYRLYVENGFSLHRLADEMHQRGLRSKSGKRVHVSHLAFILRNPFYVGVIRIRRTGESFVGVHQPLVSKDLFDRAQATLDGKANGKIIVHRFLYRRMIVCGHCGRAFTGEKQKGHVYYRCHSRGCIARPLRAEMVDDAICAGFAGLHLTDEDVSEIQEMLSDLMIDWKKENEERIRTNALQIAAVNDRLARLTDAYIDGALEKSLFDERKIALLMDRAELERERDRNIPDKGVLEADILKLFERIKTLWLTYKKATPEEKREILKTVTSNLVVDGKNVVVELRSPFREIAKAHSVLSGPPSRSRVRTRAQQIFEILKIHVLEQNKKRRAEEEFQLAA
ncbi:MAG TPA: recombinase family protein [Bryobacteraceae bacterium]|nr:recombinase family protein [Bryobacteraceae bacterium]